MSHLPFRGALVVLLAVPIGFTGPAVFAQVEYQSQNTGTLAIPGTFMHSGIVSTGGGTIWDNGFSGLVQRSLVPGYNEAAFAFMQCFGGGMIDELELLPLGPASYTSAARHDQPSWAHTMDAASNRRLESLYNLHYAPAAGGANPSTQRQAAITGRNNDLFGPVRGPNNPAPFNAAPFRENPQFTSSGMIGDALTLRRNSGVNPSQNTQYRAILFGGATASQVDFGGNGNSTRRIHDALLAAGYAEADIYVMFSGGHLPANQRPAWMPNWVDDGTRVQDMVDSWDWMRGQTNNDTQVYFWSSWGHGTRWFDAATAARARQQQIRRGLGFNFDVNDGTFLTQIDELFNFHSQPGQDPNNLPYFEIVSDVVVPDLSVTLNGEVLALLRQDIQDLSGVGAAIEYHYRFELDAQNIAELMSAGNDVVLDWSGLSSEGSFILGAGPTLGDGANGIVPEPASVLLLIVGLAAAHGLRRSRRSR